MTGVETFKKELGKRIRGLRKLKGLTQEKLGEKSGLSYKFIGELERGNVNISLKSLLRISNALGIYIGDLFPQGEKPSAVKVVIKQKSPTSKLSQADILLVRKALRLLNNAFSKF